MNKVSENPFKNRISKQSLLLVVTTLFVTLYLVSNVMAVKVVGLFDVLYFDAGTITFPLAYMLGDVLTEIWGYRTSRKVIILTLLCNVLMVVCTRIGVVVIQLYNLRNIKLYRTVRGAIATGGAGECVLGAHHFICYANNGMR